MGSTYFRQIVAGRSYTYPMEGQMPSNCESGTFVEDGFNLDVAISFITRLDSNTLLLASSYGDALNSTSSGGPRTVRLWGRGQPVMTPLFYSRLHTRLSVSAWSDIGVSCKYVFT